MPTWLPVLWVLLLAALPPCAGDCNPDALDDDKLNQMADSTTRRSFPNGTVHTYRCKNGYRPANERRNATCRGTLWELDVAQPLNCRGVSCGAPGGQNGIEHGAFRSHVFNFPNKVQFNCDRGHRLHTHNDQPVGPDYAIYCQSDGKWTAPPPKCLIVTCPALASVDNGQVDKSEGIKYRSTAYYACNGGYRLMGPSTRGCQENGTWSGVEPVCETIKCPKPDHPPHGHVLVTGTEIGDIIVYKCLTDDSKVSSTCLAQGVWSRDPPACPPVVVTTRTTTTTTTSTTTTTVAPKHCSPLSGPSNGKLFSAEGFGLNASVIFSCNDGYVMRGPTNMTCRPGGLWDPPVPPTCFAPPPWLIILSVCLAGLASLVLCCLGLFYILKRRRSKSPPAQGYRRQIRKPGPYDARTRDEVTHLGKPFPVTSL